MNTLKLLTLTVMLSVSQNVLSQTFDASAKAYGHLVLHDQTLEGTIDVNMDLDQVLLSIDNSMKIYSARDVKEIIIKGKSAYVGQKLNDEFFLMEVVTSGQISILHKSGIEKDPYTHKEYSGYFVEKKGHLQELEKKKDFLDLFGDDEKWMSIRIKNQGYDLENKADIRAAFDYYNQSFEASNPSP
ncbi:MAG: hypothetical protein CMB80_15440 [Flammeovirgaceae bacterium]|nr:hypothetical protein [Flammeovirgaceae bacterium]MBE61732.1 hypothetical protein [Flammeovirgaceae bacterium]MBR08027.1 hypothetical protein [Rickettsiales bacterium]|tara:strand:- start:155 stop:712 length:558 start_codon:yes stop_codon:yes gene_type:complete